MPLPLGPRKPPHSRSFRPSLEGLESREVLSAMMAPHAEISALRASHHHAVATINQLANAPSRTVSTVPANGDLNPYGVAFVPKGFARGGVLRHGDVLVSNFNNSDNLQGTGTTIMRVTPGNQASVFYQAPAGSGLTTALGVLRRGFVLVGNLPSTDGTSATAMAGSLKVLDKNGNLVANLTDPSLLNGPWDLTVFDQGNRAQVFVSNVLSGTVTRLNLRLPAKGGFQVVSSTQIASGYTHRGDPAAFELGPTGLVYDHATDTLFVASTADNVIFAVPNAGRTQHDGGTGTVVYQDDAHLHGPLGMTQAADGNLIVANGDAVNPDPNNPSTLVEFTRRGQFVGQFSISTSPGGAFGVATAPDGAEFAAVNDNTNSVTIWKTRRRSG
ncbi:NHL repeat-containing protein [Singulisphaera acidiphila]|uniref:NHL repeat protein n=1 Tax=Singulisphaera acidiphila (strain ATCC BAA-1392 / DSM 18658 / VKM B-2454 / MOB10) TaxID=886293 RepID=L0DBF3_SINAD|nr:hypothetical protein [Singulisphaera acidiphila]AGA25976.1 hypothetical protein Sinac_1597 [Singulisphaera acidiphila DSM 18658]